MVESVYPRLEPLLPQVTQPVQYVGGELNSVVKDWESADVRWALMYPDAYEVGLPNQGLQILYEVLNGRDGVLAGLGCQFLELQLQLVEEALAALRARPKHVALHLGDHQLQVLDHRFGARELGARFDQRCLQRIFVIGKRIGCRRHACDWITFSR